LLKSYQPAKEISMNLFQKYLVEEFAEDYQEGHLTRREALKLILGVTGSLFAANSILAACTPPPETPAAALAATATSVPDTPVPADTPLPTAALEPTAPTSPTAAPTAVDTATTTPAAASLQGTVSPDDPAVQASDVQFPGQDAATLLGYLARPAGEGSYPVVLVCHENRGLTEHIQDVTRRLAKAGYVALAVDLLSRRGGVSAFTSEEVPGLLGNTAPDQFVQDFRSGWEYLKTLPYTQPERVGMVGFCFGGGVTWLVATRMPELRAAVPFYGPHPPVEDVPVIQAAVRAVYAGNDQRINQGIPAIEEAMQQNNKIYQKLIYPGVDHAFHNDTGGRYNAEAAQDAWSKTLEWFGMYLT
jgi:carboxymethylenebutenolidase